jgi:hypothetical protein
VQVCVEFLEQLCILLNWVSTVETLVQMSGMYLAKQVLAPDLECELTRVTKYKYRDLSVLGFKLLEGCKNKDSMGGQYSCGDGECLRGHCKGLRKNSQDKEQHRT